MNKEFFDALECLANENNIPLDALVEKIDATLQEMIDDGTVSALSEQFLGEDILDAIG